MVRVLVLTFYYKPDLCAGSFRATALVNHLARHDVEIDLVTTAPNRYSSFKPKASKFESNGNVRVHRIPMPAHDSGMIDQIMAFKEYYRNAMKLVSKNNYDIVFATSSRLFTAFLGARIANKKKTPLYLDIRDIFLDTITDILSPKISWLVAPIISGVERYTFSSATHINLVSKGFMQYFEERYPRATFSFFTNGIDKEFLKASPAVGANPPKKDILNVLYAGNIGEGQGLHFIIPELAKRLTKKVKFRIVGDGGQRKKLEQKIAKFSIKNVELIAPMARDGLIKEYIEADVLFLHLNDYPAFKKVLPSKLFEYAAMGKPIWAGLNGYSAHFVKSEIVGCEVFSPGNIHDAVDKLDALDLSVDPRVDFNQKFNRDTIMNEMALNIIDLAKNNA